MADTNHAHKSRKRTRNPLQHNSIKKKLKVQRGEEYITKSMKVVPKTEFREQNVCCKKNCAQRINVDQQKRCFESLYSLSNWTQKTLFLRTLSKRFNTKQNANPIKKLKKKDFYHKYYLTNSDGNQMEVCLSFLIKCLQITKSRMIRAMQSTVQNETAKDSRGSYPTKKTDIGDYNFVKQFIKRYPTYESHYKTSVSNRKYLSSYLNIERLYREYSIVCDFDKRKTLSNWMFRHIFNTEFNLCFGAPKVDTCRTCDSIKVKIEAKNLNFETRQQLEEQKKVHTDLVDQTRKSFNESITLAKDPAQKTEIFTFDLQKALPTPCISTSDAYYLRSLWTYNLCVHDEVRNISYMYIWNESIASRGAQEVGSCLYKHFFSILPKDTRKVILYSDSCSGQNKNIKLALFLKKILSIWEYAPLQTIEQRFFVSGHSYNSCDRSFGIIEKQKRFMIIG